VVPNECGFINEVLTKRSLRDIIGRVMKETGAARNRRSSWTTSRNSGS
jgi:DNA-directed RNA polymerase subunit beta'